MKARQKLLSSVIIKTSLFVVVSFAIWLMWLTQISDRGILNREWPAVSNRLTNYYLQIMKDMEVTRIVASSSKYSGSHIRIYKGKFLWDHAIKFKVGEDEDFVVVINRNKITFIPALDVVPTEYKNYVKRINGIIETVIEKEIDYNIKNISAGVSR